MHKPICSDTIANDIIECIKIKTKIVEKNYERCQFLAENLSNTLVINGDGTNLKLLDEEEISIHAVADVWKTTLIDGMGTHHDATALCLSKYSRESDDRNLL